MKIEEKQTNFLLVQDQNLIKKDNNVHNILKENCIQNITDGISFRNNMLIFTITFDSLTKKK